MKKILFLPLLRMQSGHHQVAEALMDLLRKHTHDITLKKMDLLSYTNKALEKMITKGYLKWIRYAPETYNLAYKSFFYAPTEKEHSFKLYQALFLKKMEQLVQEEQPDLIVCTHGFPSFLVSRLKMEGKCKVPVINVYTDFFVNDVWGREGIDVHFLPSRHVKETLSARKHISKQRMIVTGVPVHEEFTKQVFRERSQTKRPTILVAGGNSGLGGLLKLSDELKKSSHLNYMVLCGNNKKLYQEILSWNVDHIKPLPYLSSRSEMNELYEEVDAIMTKPGGVTISEALQKGLPIFVHSALPGQEEVNLHYLKGRELVFELELNDSLEEQLLDVLLDATKIEKWKQAVLSYHKEIELENPEKMVDFITAILDQKANSRQAEVVQRSKIFHMAGA